MSLNGRISELQKKHQQISQQVETYERTPSSDPIKVSSLKKEKLRLKEEIARLS